jgi:hypothetical protein
VCGTATTLLVAGGSPVQGMSAAQATLYGALIAGVFTLLGAVAGLLAQAWLRKRGERRIEAEDAWRAAHRGRRRVENSK